MTSDTKSESTSTGTANRILDAAESLFIENGYAATSLRSISSRANVNLAATNYHFGSKQKLISAVIHRHIKPMTETRLQGLDQLLNSDAKITVKKVMNEFLSPLFDGRISASLPKLMGRVHGEPESLSRPLLEEEFGDTVQAFVSALKIALPSLSLREIQWRFHFAVGSMIHLLNIDRPLGTYTRPESVTAGYNKLLDFVTAGLTQ